MSAVEIIYCSFSQNLPKKKGSWFCHKQYKKLPYEHSFTGGKKKHPFKEIEEIQRNSSILPSNSCPTMLLLLTCFSATEVGGGAVLVSPAVPELSDHLTFCPPFTDFMREAARSINTSMADLLWHRRGTASMPAGGCTVTVITTHF